MGTGSQGTRFKVRQQLLTIHQNFEVFDAIGAKIMSAHANGLRVMDKIDLCDELGTSVLQIH